MTERFIINGKDMNLGNKSTQLVYQSPLFTELDSIVSNRTNSVDFPLTPSNLDAIDYSHLIQIQSEYIYTQHEAIYYRNGVQVFKGYGYVLSISNSAIKMTFVWGNLSAFKVLMEARLQDLQTASLNDYVTWNTLNINNSQYFYKDLNCGDKSRALPILKVNDVIDRIEAHTGLTILRGNYFNDLAIPLVTKYLDAMSNEANALHITTGELHLISDSGYIAALAPASSDIDIQHQYLGDGVYDVSEADKVRLIVQAGMYIRCKAPNNDFRVVVCACDQDGKNAKVVGGGNYGNWRYSSSNYFTTATLQNDIDITLDVANYSYIYIRLGYKVPYRLIGIYINYLSWGNVNLRLINSGNDNDGEVGWGGSYPLYRNLPDWTMGQFLKNVMKMKGLFAYAENETTINFVHASHLYTMRSQAYDWSDKVQLTKTLPTEISPTFGSYAQNNLCKYAEDEAITKNYNGALVVNNNTLDKEDDCVTLDFGACQDDLVPYWVYNADDEVWEFEEDIEPRVMRLTGQQNAQGQNIVTFEGLDWSNLIRLYYSEIQDIIYTPKSIKVSLRYTIEDILSLDLRKPVYIRQFASYFAIIKLTTKDNGIADAELLKI